MKRRMDLPVCLSLSGYASGPSVGGSAELAADPAKDGAGPSTIPVLLRD